MVKFEKVPFSISITQAKKLKLTDLQTQYLSILQREKTIEATILFFFKQGWLINFKQIYDLLLALNQAQALTPNLENLGAVENTFEKKVDVKNISLSTLSQWPFFRSLPPQVQQYFWSVHEVIDVPPGYQVVKYGERSRDLWTQIRGTSSMTVPTSHGKKLVGHIDAPATFGELGFFLGESRTADIKTETASTFFKIPMTEKLSQAIHSEQFKQLAFRFQVLRAFLHSPFFKNLPETTMDELIFKGRLLRATQGQVLFNQGDFGNSCYVLVQGQVGIFQNQILINSLHQGSCFGEMALFLSMGQRTAQVISQTESLVLEIQQKDFYDLLSKNLLLAVTLESIAFERAQNDIKRSKQA